MDFCKYFKTIQATNFCQQLLSEISVIVQYIWLSIPNNYWNSVKYSRSHDNPLDLFLYQILDWRSEFPKLSGSWNRFMQSPIFPICSTQGKFPTVISRARKEQNKHCPSLHSARSDKPAAKISSSVLVSRKHQTLPQDFNPLSSPWRIHSKEEKKVHEELQWWS